MFINEGVDVFNADALKGGYRYTTKSPLSSVLANRRVSEAIFGLIGENIKTIVDVGSGDGLYTAELANKKPYIKVIGFDPAAEAVKIARQNYSHLSFYEGDVLVPDSLSFFKGDKFNLAILRGVLHHLPNPDLAIQNTGLISDKIIILEPNGNSPILKIIEKISPYHRQHYERSFSSKKLSQWCLKNNFEIKQLNYINFVPAFCPALLAKIIYFFQPFLEKMYFIKKYCGAQIIIYAEKT